jgi:hypothetical protein
MENNSIDCQLGYLVGIGIVKDLPHLSFEPWKSRKTYDVHPDDPDYIEMIRWDNIWEGIIMSKGSGNERTEAHSKYLYHLKELYKRYLPHTLTFRIHLKLSINKLKEFKEALDFALWDCDCSNYKLDDENWFEFKDYDGMMDLTTIRLKLECL